MLNRYRVVKPYRGFESLRLRQNNIKWLISLKFKLTPIRCAQSKVQIGRRAFNGAKGRPASVRNVAVTLDGVTHKEIYYVQGSCDFGEKKTQVGGSPAESIAKLLLSELVRGGRN